MSAPHLTSASGQLATFNTDLSVPLKEMKVHFYPVQASGTPSPDNVLPISGWDGIEVSIARFYRKWEDTGNNSEWNVGYFSFNGTITNMEGYMYTPDYIDVSNVDSLEFDFTKSTTDSPWYRLIEYDENKNKVNHPSAYANHRTYIPTDNAKYIRISCNTSSVVTLCSPNPTTLPITFPQTIYGGYVDLVKGEVVETHEQCYLTSSVESLNAQYITNTNIFFRCQTKSAFEYDDTYSVVDLLCETLTPVKVSIHTSVNAHVNCINRRFNASNKVAAVMSKATFGIVEGDTLEEMKDKIDAYLAENPICISYKLATPNVYPLTPQTIKALKGINNIFSDANGNVDVTYWKH